MAKAAEPILPTPERAQHGFAERADRPILPTSGDYQPLYIVVDLRERMWRRGAITAEEKLAGERFRSWFTLAQLEALRGPISLSRRSTAERQTL